MKLNKIITKYSIKYLNKTYKYCQRRIEMETKCLLQCTHCKIYYKPLL